MRNIETCRIRDIEHPFIGEWSLKDIVGHVASLGGRGGHGAARTDERAGVRRCWTSRSRELDHWNQDHVERKRDLNFWSVLEQLRGGRQRLLEELAAFRRKN